MWERELKEACAALCINVLSPCSVYYSFCWLNCWTVINAAKLLSWDEDLFKTKSTLMVTGDSFFGGVRQLEVGFRVTVRSSCENSVEPMSNTTMSMSITVFHCQHRHMPICQTSPNPAPNGCDIYLFYNLAALIAGKQPAEFRLVDFIVSLGFIACHYSDIWSISTGSLVNL